MPQRIVIIGTSCSGKSTLARQLSQQLSIQYIELDELHWLPDWQERDVADFRHLVTEAVAGESWVVDGNYSCVRDILWPHATLIVWLNYPLLTVLFQAVKRTLMRTITRQPVCAGNTETFWRALLSRDSIIRWILQTHYEYQREYSVLLESELTAQAKVIICSSRQETKQLLQAFE